MPAISTRDEIIRRVAEALRVVPYGDDVPDTDRVTIERDLLDIIAELRREGVAAFDEDTVPVYAANALADYVAGMAASKYMSSPQAVQPYLIKMAAAKVRLRRLEAESELTDEYVHKEYF